MEDISTKKFTLDSGIKEPKPVLQEEIGNLKIKKLGRRLTLFSILIPVLLITILAVAYFDIKQKVSGTQSTGTLKLHNLAKNLESRFSSLSLKQAKLEEFLAKEKGNTSQSTASLGIQINKIELTLKKLDKVKIDAGLLSKETKKITINIKQLKNDLAKIKSKVAVNNNSVENRINKLAIDLITAEKQNSKLQQSLELLANKNLSKQDFDKLFKIERMNYKDLLRQKYADFDAKIAIIELKQKRLNELIKNSLLEKKEKPKPKPKPATRPPAKPVLIQKPSAITSGTQPSPSQTEPVSPKQGEITEQTIE